MARPVNAGSSQPTVSNSGALSGTARVVGAMRAVGNAVANVVAQTQSALDAVGRFGLRASAAAGLVIAPMTAAAKAFADAGAAINTLTERTKAAAAAFAGLSYAVRQAGATTNDLASAMVKVNGLLDMAALKSDKDAIALFQQLGLSWSTLASATPEDRLQVVGQAINNIIDPIDRAAMAVKFFGESGASILPMFAQGSAGIAQMRREADALGLVLDDKSVASAKGLSDAWQKVKDVFTGLYQQIGRAIAPQLTEVAQRTVAVVKVAVQWVKDNQALIASIFKVASAIASVGAALSTAGWLPLGAAIGTAVYGAVKAWGVFGDAVTKAADKAIAAIRPMYEWTMKVVDGINDSLMAGDIAGAVNIAWTAARVAWIRGVESVASVLPDGLASIVAPLGQGNLRQSFQAAWAGVQIVFAQGVNALEPYWLMVQNAWDDVAAYLEFRWQQATDYVRETWDGVVAWFESTVTTIQGYWDAITAPIVAVGDTAGSVASSISAVAGAVFDVAQGVYDALAAIAKTLADTVSGMIQGAVAAFLPVTSLAELSLGNLIKMAKQALGMAAAVDPSGKAAQALKAGEQPGTDWGAAGEAAGGAIGNLDASPLFRRMRREQEMRQRMAEREAAIAAFRADRAGILGGANTANAGRGGELSAALQNAQAAAEQARIDAAMKQFEDAARTGEVARAAQDAKATASDVAGTFSASAVSMMGGGGPQERTAKAVEATQGAIESLVDIDRQLLDEQRAVRLQLQVTA